MRYLLFSAALFFCLFSFGQYNPPTGKSDSCFTTNNKEGLWCVLEKEASTDKKEWQTYLSENIKPDKLAWDTIPPGRYKVKIQFVVDTGGRLVNVKPVEDPGYGLGAAAANVIAAYPRRWTPAERNGRKIKSYHIQTVTFILEEEECEDSEETVLLL